MSGPAFRIGGHAQFRAGHPHEGKIVTLVSRSPLLGFSNADGSVVDCQMWVIHPPMEGRDGRLYNVAGEPHLLPIA